MAKDYYSSDEAADVLGISASDLQSLVNDGRLQEYDQDGQIVFKIEDVERIVANEGSSIVDLDVVGADEPPTPVAPAKPASSAQNVPSLDELTSDINLLGLEASSVDLDLSPSPAAAVAKKAKAPEPPSEASTLDLADSSGSLGKGDLEKGLGASDVFTIDEAQDRPGRGKDDTAITSGGISVFDDADLQIDVDPAAKTQITAPVDHALALDSVGSGSGLLDLTRESDDTSLGAELLDVISPSEATETETQEGEVVESDTGTLEAETVESDTAMAVEDEPASATAAVAMVPVMMVHDPAAPAFTGLAAVTTLALLVVALAATSQIQGVWPNFLSMIDAGTNLYIYAGGLVLLAGIAWFVGWSVGRSSGKPKAAKAPKPAKAPKAKKKGK